MSRFSSTLKFALFGLLLLVPLSSCTFPDNVVQSADKNIASITIDRSSIPERIGAGLFDEAGIKLLVTYEGGTGETIPVTASMLPESTRDCLSVPGTYTVSILFRGNEASFSFTIVSTYNVRFFSDGYGSDLLHESKVLPGEKAVYRSDWALPTKDPKDANVYTFYGWTPSLDDSIVADTDFYATYLRNGVPVPLSPVIPSSGIFNYSAAEDWNNTKAAEVTAALESYAMKTHIAGIPLYDDAGIVEFSSRLTLPTRKYIAGYGFGSGEGTIDAAGKMYDGAITESTAEWKSYLHTATTTDSGTFNYANSYGSDVEDRSKKVTSALYQKVLNDSKTAFTWRTSLASALPIMVDDKNVVTTGSKSATWRIPVHTGAGYTYATDATAYATYNGREVKLEDYITSVKAILDNGWRRASGMADSTSGFAGVAAYNTEIGKGTSGKPDYTTVGYQADTTNSAVFVTFNSPCTQANAMSYLSSIFLSPIPADFITAVTPAKYGLIGDSSTPSENCANILSLGAYVPTYWEKDKTLAYRKNTAYFEKDRSHYDGVKEVVISGTGSDVTTYKAFLNNELDMANVPSDYLTAHKSDANALKTLGPTVFKMNVNSCTQAQWEYYFGTKGSIKTHTADQYWKVKPIMSNDDFLDGVYFAMDRATLANKLGRNPVLGLFSGASMMDSTDGVSYRNTDAGKSVEKPYTDVDPNGFSTDTSTQLFKKAMAALEANGSYTKGTADNPTTIELEYIFRYQTMIDNIGSIIKNGIESVFNTACPGYKLVINETVAGTSYIDAYDRMDHGEYDFADGAIAGSTTETLPSMICFCSDDLAKGFNLSWGEVTAAVDEESPIEYDGKVWSYDGLYRAATSPSLISRGVYLPVTTRSSYHVGALSTTDTTKYLYNSIDYYDNEKVVFTLKNYWITVGQSSQGYCMYYEFYQADDKTWHVRIQNAITGAEENKAIDWAPIFQTSVSEAQGYKTQVVGVPYAKALEYANLCTLTVETYVFFGFDYQVSLDGGAHPTQSNYKYVKMSVFKTLGN